MNTAPFSIVDFRLIWRGEIVHFIISQSLTTGENYRELGENYYEQQYQSRVVANLTKRAKEFGFILMPAK